MRREKKRKRSINIMDNRKLWGREEKEREENRHK